MASGRRVAGQLLVLLGVGLLVYGAMRGDLRVGLFLVIPYVYGTGLLPFLGFVLLMIGGFLWLTSGFQRIGTEGYAPASDQRDAWEPRGGGTGERRTKHGGFVLLGPIPIVWGNDRKVLPWLVAAGVALFVLGLVFTMALR